MKSEWKEGSKWNCDNPVLLFKKSAKRSMVELKLWSRTEFEGRKKKLDGLFQQLRNIKERGEQYVSGEEIKKIKRQIDELLL